MTLDILSLYDYYIRKQKREGITLSFLRLCFYQTDVAEDHLVAEVGLFKAPDVLVVEILELWAPPIPMFVTTT